MKSSSWTKDNSTTSLVHANSCSTPVNNPFASPGCLFLFYSGSPSTYQVLSDPTSLINGYRCRCHQKNLVAASERLLSLQRYQLLSPGLPPLSGHETVNNRVVEGTDWRSVSFEGFSFQGRGTSSRGGFYVEWPAKSALQSLSLNRFSVLVVEESNTSTDKSTDTPLSLSNPNDKTPV